MIFDVEKEKSVMFNKFPVVDEIFISFKHFLGGGIVFKKTLTQIYNISTSSGEGSMMRSKRKLYKYVLEKQQKKR